MSDRIPTLLKEELALLMAPVQTTGVHTILRIVNVGDYLELDLDDVQIIQCQNIEELIAYLLNDTDIDAVILCGQQFTDPHFYLLSNLLLNLEQAQIFVYGLVPEMLADFPDFQYSSTHHELMQELLFWNQKLITDYKNWLVNGQLAVSSSHISDVKRLLSETQKQFIIPVEQMNQSSPPLAALIACSDQNPQLKDELLFLAQKHPQLPVLFLIDGKQTLLVQSCRYFASHYKLNILATINQEKVENELGLVIVRYYRRYLRWLNHRAVINDQQAGYVYQLGTSEPYAIFSWPPRKMSRIKRFYVDWERLCQESGLSQIDQAVQKLMSIYQLQASQLIVVFRGRPPQDELIAAIIELIAMDICICWIPRSVTQLLNSTELNGISQILIPLTVWQELVADEQLLATWQTYYTEQPVQLGVLGAPKTFLPYVISLGMSLVAEPKKLN
ncbi:MAG: hypothetical protein CENE_03275 [Candidatus Celerinatantimonas neptuna]|nr:MAG: hypothetical protein CENE_03275 [Candidatus Celerinatantimonas neptuna]